MSVEECILLTEEYPNYKSCLPCHHTQVLINTSNSTTRAAAHRRRRQASAGPWSSILLEGRQETRRPFCIKVAYPSVRTRHKTTHFILLRPPYTSQATDTGHHIVPKDGTAVHKALRLHLTRRMAQKMTKKGRGRTGDTTPCAYGNKNHSEISQNHEAVLLLQRDLKGGQASKVLRT